MERLPFNHEADSLTEAIGLRDPEAVIQMIKAPIEDTVLQSYTPLGLRRLAYAIAVAFDLIEPSPRTYGGILLALMLDAHIPDACPSRVVEWLETGILRMDKTHREGIVKLLRLQMLYGTLVPKGTTAEKAYADLLTAHPHLMMGGEEV